jgi:hypothetical protein
LDSDSGSGSDRKTIFDYLSSDGWDSDSDDRVIRFVYQNAFATLKIEPLDKGSIIYSFREGEIQSLIKIEYGEKLLELLQIISTEKKKLSSGQYARHLRKVIDRYPNTYYYNGAKYVLLVNEDLV